MVSVSIEGDRAIFEVEGLDKLWALKSRLDIPLAHIVDARVDHDAAKGSWHGANVGATNLPGLITAGAFYEKGRLVFYDTHKPENTIVVELNHDSYDRLVLQVRDPAGAVAVIRTAIGKTS